VRLVVSRAYLGDQLGRDEVYEGEIDFAPADTEPHINCWGSADFDTPDGIETVSYMFVEGAFVRDHLFLDFCEGGHFYRYGWIPESQLWIEDEMSIVDRVSTAVHETHERYRMKFKHMDYETAHDSACEIERKVRLALLEPKIVLPHNEDIMKVLALEGSGKSCERKFCELLEAHVDEVALANKQANHAVGSREG
jgi:hypothetical protein